MLFFITTEKMSERKPSGLVPFRQVNTYKFRYAFLQLFTVPKSVFFFYDFFFFCSAIRDGTRLLRPKIDRDRCKFLRRKG